MGLHDRFKKGDKKDPKPSKGIIFEDPDFLNERGLAFLNAEKFEESIEYFNKTLEINPNYGTAWYNKGVALQGLKKYDEALKCYDNAIKINPYDFEALCNKGTCLAILGEEEEAIKCFRKSLSINKEFIPTLFNLALHLLDRNKKEAITYLKEIIRLDPKFKNEIEKHIEKRKKEEDVIIPYHKYGYANTDIEAESIDIFLKRTHGLNEKYLSVKYSEDRVLEEKWRIEAEHSIQIASLIARGERISITDLLGISLNKNATLYKPDMYEFMDQSLLPVLLCLYQKVYVIVPPNCSDEQFEKLFGMDSESFIDMIDKERIIPLISDYLLYPNSNLIKAIIMEEKPHIPATRVSIIPALLHSSDFIRNYLKEKRDGMEIFNHEPLALGYAGISLSGYGKSLKMIWNQILQIDDLSPNEKQEEITKFIALITDFLNYSLPVGAALQLTESWEKKFFYGYLPTSNDYHILPTSFSRRLISWMKIKYPKEITSDEFNEILKGKVIDKLRKEILKLKSSIENTELENPQEIGKVINEELEELEEAFQSTEAGSRLGNVISAISIGATPLTFDAAKILWKDKQVINNLGISKQLSASLNGLIMDLELNKPLREEIFNPILQQIIPWRMDSAMYQTCYVVGAEEKFHQTLLKHKE